MFLIHNERVKLLASSFDRLSTAFVAVGVLGQVLSLSPAQANWSDAAEIGGWLFGAFTLHWLAQIALGRLKP
jgi:hypothetical protein